jgi:hypothetical protein
MGKEPRMTTYLCDHPSHHRAAGARPVDVSAQVRLERALVPRLPVYLAHTESVLRGVERLDPSLTDGDRVAAVQRIVTGETWPVDAPVLLLSSTTIDRAPGLYELDELRRDNPAVERIATRWLDGGTVEPVRDDVVIVHDQGADIPTGAVSAELAGVRTDLTVREATVLPQGAYPLGELSRRLADAASNEDALVEALRATPASGPLRLEGVLEPWRVVVTCPTADPATGTTHQVVFTGDGTIEPPVVTGTPAGGMDLALEGSAAVDLEPRGAVARLARRLDVLLAGELAVAALLVGLAWVSGGLAFAARETPVWLGLAIAFGLTAVAFAIVPRFAVDATDRNPDDTFELRRFYASRLELFGWAPAVSVGAFLVALLCAIAPPALADDVAIGVPSVTFATTEQPVIAHVHVEATGLSSDDLVGVELREFDDLDTIGTVVGRSEATGGPTGIVPIDTSVALRPQARFLTIQTWTGSGSAPGTCTPATGPALGCTVVAVPPNGAGAATGSPATATATSTSVIVGPTTTPSVSATASLSPTASPTG